MRFVPRSIRGRLWATLGLLSLAIVFISSLSWYALQRVDSQLQQFHKQSLSQVAKAIDLSKRSSDLATSAPYLLNQRSNYLIEQEGEKLLNVLDRVRNEWPNNNPVKDEHQTMLTVTNNMQSGIEDLVVASQRLDRIQSDVRQRVAVLRTMRESVSGKVKNPSLSAEVRLFFMQLQSMYADVLNAAYADNLIRVGEEQRQYQYMRSKTLDIGRSREQIAYLSDLDNLVTESTSIFELRRRELSVNQNAQNALFRIRRDANDINNLASTFAETAENVLTQERNASSSTIRLTRLSVATISLASLTLALVSGLYVSRYIALNIGKVSEAMVRLASGDRTSILPRKISANDEIGDLFQSFRGFRANALRLDRSNKMLDKRNALFEKVFVNISDGIAITDCNGKLTASNPAFKQIFRVERISGSLVDWLHKSDFAQSVKESDLTIKYRGVVSLLGSDGQVLEIRVSQLPEEERVWLISDVTEQRKVAERVEQIDRIELLGRLAGNTAHDFGNILSSIRTHSHLLSVSHSDKASNIAAIENAVDYGASLTDRLLAFARQQPLSPEVFDVNGLVYGMTDLIEIGLKNEVKLTVNSSDQPLLVRADPGQLESAIFNLILNGNSAITGCGRIQMSICENPKDTVEIKVADSGSGMSSTIKKQAVEPFFTTRASSGGTGLGLSIVYGFINQSGGNLEIESEEGSGTTVTIQLPLVSSTD